MPAVRLTAFAVASGRAGFVLFDGTRLVDWGATVKATHSAALMAGYVQARINEFQPNVVVSEKCNEACRKGVETQNLIGAIARTASHNCLLDVSVERPRKYDNKYDEATALAKRYPEIAGHLPPKKPAFYDSEPRGMILFEAIALAEEVIYGPPESLAAAMG